MPIIRKILNVGDSKAITIPKSWLESAEENAGKKIIAIALEVDRVITISPVFEKDHIKETPQDERK
jgi:antitoxin component of MazEF toxin-antitoxin module